MYDGHRKTSVRRSAGRGLGLAAITVITSNARHVVTAQTPTKERPPRIIESLNDCVQERFEGIRAAAGDGAFVGPRPDPHASRPG